MKDLRIILRIFFQKVVMFLKSVDDQDHYYLIILNMIIKR